jgi:tetratricopeptide (TPR) repeat protein
MKNIIVIFALLHSFTLYAQTTAIGWFKKGLDATDNNEKIQCYTKAIELNYKPLAHAYNNRGVAKDDLGRNQDAIDDYSQAIALDLKYDLAYWNRGNAKKKLYHSPYAAS